MKDFLDLCKKYFETNDFYEVLKVDRDANEKQIKKAYHKLSLIIHPDRVNVEEKVEATEKFKILSKIYYILSDDDKRKIYNENGYRDDDYVIEEDFDWMTFWKSKFKKITVEDLDTCKETYIGSPLEAEDLKKAYLESKGDMDIILESVPFTNCEDEPRLKEMVKEWIAKDEVPEYKLFTEEPEAKRRRRHRKYEKEKKIVEDSRISDQDLFLALQEKQENRNQKMQEMISKLEEKYKTTKSRGRKSLKKSENATNNNAASTSKVKRGKITKRKK